MNKFFDKNKLFAKFLKKDTNKDHTERIEKSEDETKTQVPSVTKDDSPPGGVRSSGSSGEKKTSAHRKKFPFNLPDKLQIFLSQNGIAYVEIQTNSGPLALTVGCKELNNIIRQHAYDEGVPIRKQLIKEVNEFLIAHAQTSGVIKNVYQRIAPNEDGIELDVGDEKNTRILIRPGKVEILDQKSNTIFCRSSISKAMVIPAPVGNLKLVMKYLNFSDPDQWLLIAYISFILAHAKIESTKFVHLVIQGDRGTGKSFTCDTVILSLIDPNLIGTQVFPGNAKDLAIMSQNSHVLCFDNMRNFRAAMSDILCIASTGGALSNRALYTDADQHILHIHAPLVLNGIHSFINESDLAQRCLQIRTLPLPESDRQSEAVMIKEFKDDFPVIFRGLLDLIAQILKYLPKAKVTQPQRMYDFVHWLAAMEMAEGMPEGKLQSLYSNSLQQAQLDSLMENLLSATLIKFSESFGGSEWTGTPSELFHALVKIIDYGEERSPEWPHNAIALSKRLNGLKASLLTQGVDVVFGRGKERKITIKKIGGQK